MVMSLMDKAKESAGSEAAVPHVWNVMVCKQKKSGQLVGVADGFPTCWEPDKLALKHIMSNQKRMAFKECDDGRF